jgi:quercetin dioxygenase-like cupin family protein
MSKIEKIAQKTGGLFLVGLGACCLTSAAVASPGSGVTPTNYVTATLSDQVQGNHDGVKFQTKDPTVVRVQKLEFAPGAYTGFHHHPGVVIVSIASGSLNLVDTSCATETYSAGSVFVESDDHPHQAVSPNGATVYVTYVVPASSPPSFREEEQVPFCATKF